MRNEEEHPRQKKSQQMLTLMMSWTMTSTISAMCFKRYSTLCPKQLRCFATQIILQAGKKSKSSQIEEASKERRGKNKIFAHIQKEIETKENNKPKLNENDQVLDLCTSSEC